ncbi:hypothetical protein EYR38_007104 [Pleurotus pulmonarius]|nr:hypothetical protein EYR38_007104 [Pleurotus pulmonarius]
MAPTFDPNNSQPDYGVHDDSMMVDDTEVAPHSSPSPEHSVPNHTDDEYATPPNRKIPLEAVEAMMSAYDQTAADHSSPMMEDPSRLFDDEPRDSDEDDVTPNEPVAESSPPAESSGAGGDEGDEYVLSDMDDGENNQDDDEESNGDDHEPSDFADEDGEGEDGEDGEDADAVGDTDIEEDDAAQYGGGKRDTLDPNDILEDGVKRAIKLTPRATRTTQASAAQRDPIGRIPALQLDQDGQEIMSPPPSPSPQRPRLSSPSLEPLEHGEVHWSDGSNGPVISLHINNTAEDDPEHGVYKLPIADIREKPESGLLAVSRYLLDHVAGSKNDPADYGIILPKGSTSHRTADEIDDEREAQPEEEYDVNQLSPRRPGRLLTQTLDMVDCGIGLLQPIRRSLAELAGVSENFIQARWDKKTGGTGKGLGQARWRTWVRYYHTKPSIIMDRTEVTLQEGEEKWHNSVASRCYERFKQLFPDTHADIIDNLTALAELERQPQTVHQRGREWDEYCRDLSDVMQRGHEMGFEACLVACGSNIHQDKGLGFVHETQFAEGFIEGKVGSKQNDHLGHFASYVQNKVSDSILEDEQNSEPAKPAKPAKLTKPTKPTKPSQTSKTSKPSTSKNPPSVISISSEPLEPGEGLSKTGGRYHQARHALSAAAAAVGLALNVHQFPWSTLPVALVKAGVRIVNFPLGVIFPGLEKDKARGITAASAAHVDLILERLSSSAKQRLRFELIPAAEIAATERRKLPVIINAAPQCHSKIKRGSRMLADGTVDDKGPRQLKPGDQEESPDFVESVDEDGPSTARTRIRKRKERTPPSDLDVANEAERRVLRSERKGKGKAVATGTESAISISDDGAHGAKPKRLRRASPDGASPDAAIEVKTPQGIPKRPVSGLDAFPPVKKARSIVEVVIPTPRKKVPGGVEKRESAPDATSTPKAMAKAASGSKSKGQAKQSRSALAKDAVPADTLPATTLPATTPAAATPATTTAFATAVVPKASKVAAPAEPSERPSTSKEDAAPEAAHGSDPPATTEKPLPSTSIPEAAPKAALRKGSTADAARKGAKRPGKGGAESQRPRASKSGLKSDTESQRPRASKSGLKSDTAPSEAKDTDPSGGSPTMTKDARLPDTSRGEAKDTDPSGGSPTMTKDARLPGTSKGEAKFRRPSASKSDTKGGTAAKAAPARRPSSSKAPEATPDVTTGTEALALKGSTTDLVATSAPPPQVIGDACPTTPPPATPALAAPAIHVDDQQLPTNDEGDASETPTFRPVPRRLPPSTSLGGLDSVRPYEGLPRRTTLPVDPHAPLQVGGHGRVPNHPRGELSSNQEEAHEARGGHGRVPNHPRGELSNQEEAHEARRRDRSVRIMAVMTIVASTSIAGGTTLTQRGRSQARTLGAWGNEALTGANTTMAPAMNVATTLTTHGAENLLTTPPIAAITVMMKPSGTSEQMSMQMSHVAAPTPHAAANVATSQRTDHVAAPTPHAAANVATSQRTDHVAAPTPHAAANIALSPMTALSATLSNDYQRMREFYPQDRRHNRDHYDRPLGGRYPSDYDFDPRDAGFHDPSYYYRDGYGDVYRDRRRPEGYHARPQSPSRARSPGVTAVPEGSRASVAPAGATPETEATEP